MEDLMQWGPWVTAATAIAIALRTHATSSASTIRQLQVWLAEAQKKIQTLEGAVQLLEQHRDRLAAEVERLTPFARRAESLARELRELHRAHAAGGGAESRAPEHHTAGAADVVHLRAHERAEES